MGTVRNLLWLSVGFAAAGVALAQQQPPPQVAAPHGSLVPGTRSYLGLNLGHGASDAPCPATALVCSNRDRSATLYAGTMFNRNWGAELGYVDMGRVWRAGNEYRAQGLNLSLVGRTQVFPALNVYGKLGTTYGRSENTGALGNTSLSGPDQGFGLSFGGGVSYDITPRVSATLEWDSHDMRFANGAREPVRSTNLGLRFRY